MVGTFRLQIILIYTNLEPNVPIIKIKREEYFQGHLEDYFWKINFQKSCSSFKHIKKGCSLLNNIVHVLFGIIKKSFKFHSEILFSFILILDVMALK